MRVMDEGEDKEWTRAAEACPLAPSCTAHVSQSVLVLRPSGTKVKLLLCTVHEALC